MAQGLTATREPKCQKTKIMASGPITSWEIDGERVETVSDFIFLVSGDFFLLGGDAVEEVC